MPVDPSPTGDVLLRFVSRRSHGFKVQVACEELPYMLKSLIGGVRADWDDPKSSACFGLLPSSAADAEARQGVVDLLTHEVLRMGRGVRGLRALRLALATADTRAKEVTPASYDWREFELDYSSARRVEIDDEIAGWRGVSLRDEGFYCLLEDWVATVIDGLSELFDLLESGMSEEWLAEAVALHSLFSRDADAEEECEVDVAPDLPPPRRRLHEDVVCSITPTNGPNASVRAIESSVRGCGVRLAA